MDWSARDGETARFVPATAVTADGDGSYAVDLHPAYAIGGTKPNGGYLLAMMGRAAVEAAHAAGATQTHVVCAGAQYSSSPDNGPARIVTEVLRVGRSATQVRTRLVQGDATTGIEARFTLGTLPEGGRPFWGGIEPVVLPPIEECHRPDLPMGPRDSTVLFDPATTIRMTPEGPVATGGGELRAWFRYEAEEAVPPWVLLYVADCLPPATFGVVATGWVPTLDLTAYVRAVPAPGPLRIRFRVQLIEDGLADEVLEAWDSEGRLVLQATQLAALRHPR
jgi:hypothetical protein